MEIGNLTNLSVRLQKIEVGLVGDGGSGLSDARLAVVNALEQYRRSRYRLGEMLSAYRKFFLLARGWSVAAIVIAGAIGCDERTIRRIVEDYDRVSGVPALVIKSLEQLGIDPSARKNASMIAKALRMPLAAIDSAAEVSMANAIQAARTSGQIVTDPTGHKPARQTREERRQIAMRRNIRTALMNVPPDRRIEEFVAALEEICFESGHVEPIMVTITPRRLPSAKDACEEQKMVA